MKVIANQLIDVSPEEFAYYQELEKNFGKDAFLGLFKTNEQGQIIAVIPSINHPTAMVLIFYFLNVMFNQRLRKLVGWGNKIGELEVQIVNLEKRMNEWELSVKK